MKNARAKRAKILFFIVKYVEVLLSSSLWLCKFPYASITTTKRTLQFCILNNEVLHVSIFAHFDVVMTCTAAALEDNASTCQRMFNFFFIPQIALIHLIPGLLVQNFQARRLGMIAER